MIAGSQRIVRVNYHHVINIEISQFRSAANTTAKLRDSFDSTTLTPHIHHVQISKVRQPISYSRLRNDTNNIYSRGADWADDEEFEDPTALPPQQIITNKDGTKTMITYSLNDDGRKVKTTRRIRITTVREHVDPAVAERKQWAKFGLEKGHPAGPSFDTTSVGENIIFRPSVNWRAQAKEAEKNGGEEKGSIKDQLKDKKVKCRICSGEHFTARCPFKDTMAPVDEPAGGAGDFADDDERPAQGGLGTGKSSYVPPHLRKGGAGEGDRMGGKFERDDLATLRVTNVCAFNLQVIAVCMLLARVDQRITRMNTDIFHLYRFPNSQKNKTSATSSNASAASHVSSLPKTERPVVPRASLSSVSRNVQMLLRLVREWMDVSLPLLLELPLLCVLI